MTTRALDSLRPSLPSFQPEGVPPPSPTTREPALATDSFDSFDDHETIEAVETFGDTSGSGFRPGDPMWEQRLAAHLGAPLGYALQKTGAKKAELNAQEIEIKIEGKHYEGVVRMKMPEKWAKDTGAIEGKGKLGKGFEAEIETKLGRAAETFDLPDGVEVEIEGSVLVAEDGKDGTGVELGAIEVHVKGDATSLVPRLAEAGWKLEIDGTVKVSGTDAYRLLKMKRIGQEVVEKERAVASAAGELDKLKAERAALDLELEGAKGEQKIALKQKRSALNDAIGKAKDRLMKAKEGLEQGVEAFQRTASKLTSKLGKKLGAQLAQKLLAKMLPFVGVVDAAVDAYKMIRLMTKGRYGLGGEDGGGSAGGPEGSEGAKGTAGPRATAPVLDELHPNTRAVVDALRGTSVELEVEDWEMLDDVMKDLTPVQAEAVRTRFVKQARKGASPDELMAGLLDIVRDVTGAAEVNEPGAPPKPPVSARDLSAHLVIDAGGRVGFGPQGQRAFEKQLAARGVHVESVAIGPTSVERVGGREVYRAAVQMSVRDQNGNTHELEFELAAVMPMAAGEVGRWVEVTGSLGDSLAGTLVERNGKLQIPAGHVTLDVGGGVRLKFSHLVEQPSADPDVRRVRVQVEGVAGETSIRDSATGKWVKIAPGKQADVVIDLPPLTLARPRR